MMLSKYISFVFNFTEKIKIHKLVFKKIQSKFGITSELNSEEIHTKEITFIIIVNIRI